MNKLLLLFIFALTLFCQSCYYSHPNQVDHWQDSDNESIDSVNFQITHHYWTGYNFKTVDSLTLSLYLPQKGLKQLEAEIEPIAPLVIPKGERIVVTDISYIPHNTTDSIWVKVASDQFTQGWTSESSLLNCAIPDDPISQFIHSFSDQRTLIFLSCLFLFLLATAGYLIHRRRKLTTLIHFFIYSSGIFHFAKRNQNYTSIYPTLLCLLVSITATIYGSIQTFVPNTWVEYYFNPTLNPFFPDLPFILSVFLSLIWLLAITTLAVFLDLIKTKYLAQALMTFAAIICMCIFLYLLFTLTIPIYIGYALLPIYIIYALYRYIKRMRQPQYLCGRCGAPLRSLNKCPHCGAINQ